VPLAAGIVAGIGGVTMQFTSKFSLGGIALGTLVTIIGYHLVRLLAPTEMRDALVPGRTYGDGTAIAVGRTGVDTALGEGVDPQAGRHGGHHRTDGPPSPRDGTDTEHERT
jgi:hypothetical protein